MKKYIFCILSILNVFCSDNSPVATNQLIKQKIKKINKMTTAQRDEVLILALKKSQRRNITVTMSAFLIGAAAMYYGQHPDDIAEHLENVGNWFSKASANIKKVKEKISNNN